MSKRLRIIFAIVIAIIVFIILGYLLVNYTGWKQFSMKAGENFQMNGISISDVDHLKFKDCIFTATTGTGTTRADVSSALNKMAQAYKGVTNPKYVFKLDDPGLSPYSFQVNNFNDKNVQPDPTANVTLQGYYKLLK